MAVKDMFKFYLDKTFLRDKFEGNFEAAPGNLDDVVLWFGDFLRELYAHIKKYLQDIWKVDFNLTKVEYIFGLPTSWKDNYKLVQLFRSTAVEAGFRTDNIILDLTEAEASAIFTAKHTDEEFKVS